MAWKMNQGSKCILFLKTGLWNKDIVQALRYFPKKNK